MTTRKKNCTLHHQEGVDAAWAHKTEEDCPYKDEEKRGLWLDGFRMGLSCLMRTVSKKYRNPWSF